MAAPEPPWFAGVAAAKLVDALGDRVAHVDAQRRGVAWGCRGLTDVDDLDVPRFVAEEPEAAEPRDARAQDEVAARVGGHDEAVARQPGKRLADDRPGHPELLGEGAFGRQPLAATHLATADAGGQRS